MPENLTISGTNVQLAFLRLRSCRYIGLSPTLTLTLSTNDRHVYRQC